MGWQTDGQTDRQTEKHVITELVVVVLFVVVFLLRLLQSNHLQASSCPGLHIKTSASIFSLLSSVMRSFSKCIIIQKFSDSNERSTLAIYLAALKSQLAAAAAAAAAAAQQVPPGTTEDYQLQLLPYFKRERLGMFYNENINMRSDLC